MLSKLFGRRATEPAEPVLAPDLLSLRRANARRYLRERGITHIKPVHAGGIAHVDRNRYKSVPTNKV